VFIEAKDGGSYGDNLSYVMQISSQIITTNKPTPSFLQAGCPSCRPTNSVKALKGKYHTPVHGPPYPKLTWGSSKSVFDHQ